MSAIIVPNVVKSGERFHHYQSEIAELGELKAKQTPSDSGIVWWLFRGITPSSAMEALESAGIYTQSRCCGCEHDCCGCSNNGAAHVRVVGQRTLVIQSFGRNI